MPPIAGILLIVGAGGGFKQTLIDTGIAEVVADFVKDSGVSVLLLAWLVAVLIRVATGSATVATITAAGIMAPIAQDLGSTEVSLLVLAIGAGSVFFSHVNDAGSGWSRSSSGCRSSRPSRAGRSWRRSCR